MPWSAMHLVWGESFLWTLELILALECGRLFRAAREVLSSLTSTAQRLKLLTWCLLWLTHSVFMPATVRSRTWCTFRMTCLSRESSNLRSLISCFVKLVLRNTQFSWFLEHFQEYSLWNGIFDEWVRYGWIFRRSSRTILPATFRHEQNTKHFPCSHRWLLPFVWQVPWWVPHESSRVTVCQYEVLRFAEIQHEIREPHRQRLGHTASYFAGSTIRAVHRCEMGICLSCERRNEAPRSQCTLFRWNTYLWRYHDRIGPAKFLIACQAAKWGV